ncbi:MAG TPA: phosphatase PAP2 family protein, partial [Flavobacteriales bacterium]|nr:phosphatase PAP2 family protein [Flavobacteriales bacterium]
MTNKEIIRNSILLCSSMLILTAIFYLWFDISIAHWFYGYRHTRLHDFCANFYATLFMPAHWLFAAIVSTVCALWAKYRLGDRRMAHGCFFFAAAIFATMVIVWGLKLGLGRYRPTEYFQHQLYGFSWLSTKYATHSMPSGHSATAFAGFYSISLLWRRSWLTVLAWLLASSVAMSRLMAGAH